MTNQLGTCPDGWKYITTDTNKRGCQYIDTNKSTCGAIGFFSNYTNEQKMDWSKNCKTQWTNCNILQNNAIAPLDGNSCLVNNIANLQQEKIKYQKLSNNLENKLQDLQKKYNEMKEETLKNKNLGSKYNNSFNQLEDKYTEQMNIIKQQKQLMENQLDMLKNKTNIVNTLKNKYEFNEEKSQTERREFIYDQKDDMFYKKIIRILKLILLIFAILVIIVSAIKFYKK